MKKLYHQSKTFRDLSEPYQQQLNSYALAAAAAGVSVLALANHCEAKIIYTPAHHVIGNGGSYKLDFTGDGTTDLTVQNKSSQTCTQEGTCHLFELLSAKMAGGNQAVHNYFGAVAMKRGMRVGPKCVFQGNLQAMAEVGSFPSSFSTGLGSWINVTNRYLGVKFKIKGQTHYGWARLNVQVRHPDSITATLTGYAYETVANKAIVAGKTKGPDVITVEPATLGRLALGRR